MKEVEIKLVDDTLPMPQYQTEGSVAFDLYSRIDVEIKPKTLEFIPLNIIVKTPEDYAFFVASRSSTPKKKGLMLANHIGIIDRDFCGEEDEVKYLAYNFTDENVKIERGERIAQGFFIKTKQVELIQIKEVDSKSRGGYGSTG